MRNDELKKILHDFYEGNTTEEQEELLKGVFLSDPVAEEFDQEREFFLYLKDHAAPEVPQTLESRLTDMIDKKAEEERIFFHRNRKRQQWRWSGGIAATLLLLIALGYSLATFNHHPKDTFSDPHDAYLALQATLKEVSSELNSGLSQLHENHTEMKEIQKEIIQEIK